jgi:hypothetical protein
MDSPKFIKNTNDRYTITKNGVITDLKTNRTIKTEDNNGNFYSVNVFNEDRIQRRIALTRTLWETFKGTIPDNHIIKKINNDELHIDNLVCIPRNLMYKNLSFKSLDGFKPIMNYETRYLISEDAQIYSIVSDKFFVINSSDNDYISVKLIDSNSKSKTYLLHRLVFCTYHDLPLDSDIIVDHIDQNKTHNHLLNLRILTKSENGKNCTPKPSKIHNPIMQYDKDHNLIAEHHSLAKIAKELHCSPSHIKNILNLNIMCKNNFYWTQHQFIADENYVCVKVDGTVYPNYKVNKNGDIVNKFGKKLMYMKINNYYTIKLTKINDKTPRKLVHRIVYESFNPHIDLNQETLINHIDENKLNNNLENLEVVDHKQNITHSCGKKIAQLSDDGQIIKIFDSISEAAQYLKKPGGRSNIGNVCNGKKNKNAYGFGWKFV